ncbi:hypothetical protein [Shimia biformata]|uniref:hypothetical protein n=1 Tax=Shimia biformata TaxID=1294299 RepID=UPI0019526568|nr:hypothetical protein [Shimia biformata]
MSDITVTKTRLFEGIWEGLVTRASGEGMPNIEVTHLEHPVRNTRLTAAPDGTGWVLRVPIPVETIADGVQTYLIRDKDTDEVLEIITLISGEVLADDIRAEMDLLRAELDMLKRAFRRHCIETM